jgi:hypothetical protein
MRQLRLGNHMHSSRFLPGHPRRKMSAGTVGLHDDQIRLAPVSVQPNDVDALAEARMKRIANDNVVAMMMGSMLLVRRALASRTSRRPSPIRPSCKATRSSILRPTTSSHALSLVNRHNKRSVCAAFLSATCWCWTTCFYPGRFQTSPELCCKPLFINDTSCAAASWSRRTASFKTGAPTSATTL